MTTTLHQTPIFEHLGYFKEYYIGRKLIGHVRCKQDRELTGYAGRTTSTLTTPVTLDNGRKLRKGVEVMTMTYPLNGKIISR